MQRQYNGWHPDSDQPWDLQQGMQQLDAETFEGEEPLELDLAEAQLLDDLQQQLEEPGPAYQQGGRPLDVEQQRQRARAQHDLAYQYELAHHYESQRRALRRERLAQQAAQAFAAEDETAEADSDEADSDEAEWEAARLRGQTAELGLPREPAHERARKRAATLELEEALREAEELELEARILREAAHQRALERAAQDRQVRHSQPPVRAEVRPSQPPIRAEVRRSQPPVQGTLRPGQLRTTAAWDGFGSAQPPARPSVPPPQRIPEPPRRSVPPPVPPHAQQAHELALGAVAILPPPIQAAHQLRNSMSIPPPPMAPSAPPEASFSVDFAQAMPPGYGQPPPMHGYDQQPDFEVAAPRIPELPSFDEAIGPHAKTMPMSFSAAAPSVRPDTASDPFVTARARPVLLPLAGIAAGLAAVAVGSYWWLHRPSSASLSNNTVAAASSEPAPTPHVEQLAPPAPSEPVAPAPVEPEPSPSARHHHGSSHDRAASEQDADGLSSRERRRLAREERRAARHERRRLAKEERDAEEEQASASRTSSRSRSASSADEASRSSVSTKTASAPSTPSSSPGSSSAASTRTASTPSTSAVSSSSASPRSSTTVKATSAPSASTPTRSPTPAAATSSKPASLDDMLNRIPATKAAAKPSSSADDELDALMRR